MTEDEKAGVETRKMKRQRSRTSSGSKPEDAVEPGVDEKNANGDKNGDKNGAKEEIFGNMNPKWKNWWVRSVFTLLMIGGFAVIITLGPLAILILIFAIQVKCYHEIISIGHIQYKKFNLPWFRTLSWYFLLCSNYFFYGEMVAEYFHGFSFKQELFRWLFQHHRLISFSLYTVGIMMFVLSLRKNYYKTQFALFGWYQITLGIILVPSHLIIQNFFQGSIWFYLPVSMVICNDIWAYIFGFFFGKTRLIKLSPKKTWEGFIGGFLATVFFGLIACEIMSKFKYFHCPVQYLSSSGVFKIDCERSPIFELTHYFTIPNAALQVFNKCPAILKTGTSAFLSLMGFQLQDGEIWMNPMAWHAIVLACFSSLIAPFGGFFASGFKRAFKVKDFGDTIPGHGGIMDRFDCQYLMATFVNVYIASFIRASNPNKLLKQIMMLQHEDQVAVFRTLHESLVKRGLLSG
ncbi:phosphatidate cytidylyltransferase 2-like isoform X2 [Rhopilema esculentum]|uniref:phosphatidate cytidylyltransferase 2-like isoform X2 n=1 Tax=Rhopilema esculentum TaxID=499914 RepID=UPI0031CF1C66